MKNTSTSELQPLCRSAAVIRGNGYRITMLTQRLIRLEYDARNRFEDRPTQTVLNRNFSVPGFEVHDRTDSLEVSTPYLRLFYDKRLFSPSGLRIELSGNYSNYRSVWRYGDKLETLGGTARTLDAADGPVELGDGLLSRNGFSVLDDSRSMVFIDENRLAPGNAEKTDLYFFGYGHDYLECLRDFYRLSGSTPLLPRFALGNWWSRFHRYDEQEYRDLIRHFEREDIPFSVAVVDMDWHLTEIDPKYGSGWTGYTWNRALFPDPPRFLAWLHKHNLRVTLNVHPAGGVRAFEDAYPSMAEALGVDAASEEPIPFDCSDNRFMAAYFNLLHRPLEEQGVDFWWIDWQQGSVSRIPGMDPLWVLNRTHYADQRLRGKRALILSRYAGPGSHRYPLGFSGDTIVSWKSLDFQPYFTACASNIGYGWWSHDIGGHMRGCRDDELAVRWLQFGVFSPVNRLHSSDSPFQMKEPWEFNLIAQDVMERFLRLRHALIPYLYTMNRRASIDGEPLVEPMYYASPETPEAYEVPNEYRFGTELIVCPITKPMDHRLCMGSFRAWLPDGVWIDFFSGRVYTGGRMLELWRDIGAIPVLAKAGGIVPLSAPPVFTNSVENPENLEIRVFAGADGTFTLWEDDGAGSEDGVTRWAFTHLSLDWGRGRFTISPAQGNFTMLPKKRSWEIRFCGITRCDVVVAADGLPLDVKTVCEPDAHALAVSIPETEIGREICVELRSPVLSENNGEAELLKLLKGAQLEIEQKERILHAARMAKSSIAAMAEIAAMNLPRPVFDAVFEIFAAKV